MRAELFSRMEWVVEEPGIDQVRLVVKHLAQRLGQSLEVTVNRSTAAIPALLEHCREVAIMKYPDLRRLTHSDLNNQFMAAISISLPNDQWRRARDRESAILGGGRGRFGASI